MGDSLINQTLHESYLIERLVAEGGMGVVYEAAHLRLARRFAIKVLTPAAVAQSGAAQRFEKDWSMVSSLQHRHIVDPTDFFMLPDGRPVLVTEMLTARTLSERVSEKGRFEVGETSVILRQICNGLQVAHKKRLVHGDLRPKKVLLCKTREKDDFVKIIGFGTTKLVSPEKLPVEELAYLAPEQAVTSGEPKVDHRADAYSVAAMIFEMLTGRAPLMAETPAELRNKVLEEEPPLLRTVREDIPEPVEYVIAKSLRKEPQRRYPSLGALSREFSSTLSV